MASGIIQATGVTFVDTTGVDVNVPNNTITNIMEIQIPRGGKWLITAQGTYLANPNGFRRLGISSTTGTVWTGRQSGMALGAVPNEVVKLYFPYIYNAQSPTTLYLNAQQNSGTTLTLQYPGYQMVCLAEKGDYSALVGNYVSGTDSDWLSLTDDRFNGTIYYRKIGPMIQVVFTNLNLKSSPTGLNAQIADMPVNYRPKYNVNFVIRGYDSNLGGVAMLAVIEQDGDFILMRPSTVNSFPTSMALNGSVFYFVN